MNFPVRGHSFLPVNRVFGCCERILKKNVTIVSLKQYYDVFRKVGKVKVVGTDWDLLNTKSLNVYFKNLPYISEVKRIALEKGRAITVKGFRNYRFKDESKQAGKTLLKKGITVTYVKSVILEYLPLSHAISVEKKKDVDKLLKLFFGEEWKNLPDNHFKWYKPIIYDLPAGSEDTEEVCDCLDEVIGLRI